MIPGQGEQPQGEAFLTAACAQWVQQLHHGPCPVLPTALPGEHKAKVQREHTCDTVPGWTLPPFPPAVTAGVTSSQRFVFKAIQASRWPGLGPGVGQSPGLTATRSSLQWPQEGTLPAQTVAPPCSDPTQITAAFSFPLGGNHTWGSGRTTAAREHAAHGLSKPNQILRALHNIQKQPRFGKGCHIQALTFTDHLSCDIAVNAMWLCISYQYPRVQPPCSHIPLSYITVS